jgi:hypothetical protein
MKELLIKPKKREKKTFKTLVHLHLLLRRTSKKKRKRKRVKLKTKKPLNKMMKMKM